MFIFYISRINILNNFIKIHFVARSLVCACAIIFTNSRVLLINVKVLILQLSIWFVAKVTCFCVFHILSGNIKRAKIVYFHVLCILKITI